MRLTLHSDFALRVLIQVGLGGGKLTTISDIARSYGISRHHLMKVVNDLGQKGYLDTVRGRHGGMRLMREPGEINVGQVVRDTEDNLNVIGCLESRGYCRIERACVLRGILRDATDGVLGRARCAHACRFDQAAQIAVVAVAAGAEATARLN